MSRHDTGRARKATSPFGGARSSTRHDLTTTSATHTACGESSPLRQREPRRPRDSAGALAQMRKPEACACVSSCRNPRPTIRPEHNRKRARYNAAPRRNMGVLQGVRGKLVRKSGAQWSKLTPTLVLFRANLLRAH